MLINNCLKFKYLKICKILVLDDLWYWMTGGTEIQKIRLDYNVGKIVGVTLGLL